MLRYGWTSAHVIFFHCRGGLASTSAVGTFYLYTYMVLQDELRKKFGYLKVIENSFWFNYSHVKIAP